MLLPVIRYRPAKLSDAHAIAQVHVASWKVAYKGILADETLANLSVTDRAQRWTEILTASQQHTFVVTQNERVVGFTDFGPSRDEDLSPAACGEINSVYLLPEIWGQGLGRGLCDLAFEQLRADGHTTATLWVLEENSQAIGFYEKLGFQADGARLLQQGFGKWIRRYRREL